LEESPLVIFNPAEEVMYPLRGNLQDLSQKRGVEVDVKGWGDVMEGASRRMSLLVSTVRKPEKD
jgi:pantoate--beta-alanine ligase